MKPDGKQATRDGIEAYERDREILTRLIRKQGPAGLSATKFDWLFHRHPNGRARYHDDSTFILGHDANGYSERNFYLELLQHMIWLCQFDVRTDDGEIYYTIARNSDET